MVFLEPSQIQWRISPAHAVLRFGQWPGVRGGPNVEGRGDEVASASREPWVDANSYLVAWLRGMYPDRAAWLSYGPNESSGVSKERLVPYESVELGLAEAFAAGGSFVLALPDNFHRKLLAGEEKALAAWRSLGKTVRFLREHAATFHLPSGATVAVAGGTLEQTGEILNMSYRRNVCPLVFKADAPPELVTSRFRTVVFANVGPPSAAALGRLLSYASAGGMLMTAPGGEKEKTWWLDPGVRKRRADEDRDFYSLGKGHVLSYREPVADPSEFALDIIDAVGVRVRDLRLWNAGAVVGLLHRPPGGTLSVELVNYGSPRTDDFPVRVEGVFRKAVLREPASAPRVLKAVKRGTGTEITVDRLGRFASILIE
jgi:hypothetical protein